MSQPNVSSGSLRSAEITSTHPRKAGHQAPVQCRSGRQPATAPEAGYAPLTEETDVGFLEEISGPTTVPDRKNPPNIIDGYRDLLELLSRRKRLGMIAWLSVGYYEGWRPDRAEVADLIAVELGALTVGDAHERLRQRRRGVLVPDIIPTIIAFVVTRGPHISTSQNPTVAALDNAQVRHRAQRMPPP
jgi:hypothetical protein